MSNKSFRPTVIFFLRHGEPDNPKNLVKGRANYPLTARGRSQIRLQANRLLGERVAAVFSSPVRRCLESAQIVVRILNRNRTEMAKNGTPLGCGGLRVRKVNELTEWKSVFDGRPDKEARAKGEKIFNAGFEPQEKVLLRMKEFVKRIKTKYPNQTVVAVSHQGPIDLLLASLSGAETARMPFRFEPKTSLAELVRIEVGPDGGLLVQERLTA